MEFRTAGSVADMEQCWLVRLPVQSWQYPHRGMPGQGRKPKAPPAPWDFKPPLIYINGAEGRWCGHDLAQGPAGHETAQDSVEQGGGLKGIAGSQTSPAAPTLRLGWKE